MAPRFRTKKSTAVVALFFLGVCVCVWFGSLSWWVGWPCCFLAGGVGIVVVVVGGGGGSGSGGGISFIIGMYVCMQWKRLTPPPPTHTHPTTS